MRSRSVIVIAALVMSARAAWAQEASAAAVPTEKSPTIEAAPSAKDRPAPPAGLRENWRYKRHQGLWWYWQPTNQWVYWTGDRWVNYDAASYREFKNSQRGRSYSSTDGNRLWGPVRYDRWGQPQYPYSRRTSGIRQLGPVPAMGGVRSLPGWGGER